jgi:hypothetical protein
MERAARLGTDSGMWVRCQLARMPGGTRENGARQGNIGNADRLPIDRWGDPRSLRRLFRLHPGDGAGVPSPPSKAEKGPMLAVVERAWLERIRVSVISERHRPNVPLTVIYCAGGL